ncbi:hypothetical protein PTKU46_80770 [Paraburkholderia terrae]
MSGLIHLSVGEMGQRVPGDRSRPWHLTHWSCKTRRRDAPTFAAPENVGQVVIMFPADKQLRRAGSRAFSNARALEQRGIADVA